MIEREILIENKKISFSDTVKGEVTLVFIHGNSLSKEFFNLQLNSQLKNKYRLIAIDLPGCGNSEPLAPEKYNLPELSSIITKFISEFNLSKVFLIGHSLGGHIAIHSLEESISIFGICIFGTPPMNKPINLEKSYLPHPAGQFAFSETLTESEAIVLAKGYFSSEFNIPKFAISNILNADGKLRFGLIQSVLTGNYKNEVEILNLSQKVIVIIHGSNDQMVNSNYFSDLSIPKLWRGKVQYINQSGHSPQIEKPIEFNSLLMDVLNSNNN